MAVNIIDQKQDIKANIKNLSNDKLVKLDKKSNIELYFVYAILVICVVFVLAGWVKIAACCFLVFVSVVYNNIVKLVREKDNIKEIVQEKVPNNYYVLIDTNILYDSRINDLLVDPLFRYRLCIPRFVLEELMSIVSNGVTDSERARLAIENIETIIQNNVVNIIDEKRNNDLDVDMQLLNLARTMNAIIFTGDNALREKAINTGIVTSSLKDLAESLEETYGVGEVFELELVKKGTQNGEAIGYFRDGTRVVVEDAADQVGKVVLIYIEQVLKGVSGRVYFASLYKI